MRRLRSRTTLETSLSTGEISLSLKRAYIAASILSILMVVWILITPASWMIGRCKWHDAILFSLLNDESLTPAHILSKYAGHTAVHVTHILPGAIWAGLTPLQLHPTLRKTRPKLHRVSGYVFLGIALVMTVGFFIILDRDLLFENFFDIPEEEESIKVPMKPFLSLLMLYFAGTALAAIWAAKNKKFALHRTWIIRHIASGIWVSMQRFLLMTVYQTIYLFWPVTPASQKHSFSSAGFVSVLICIAIGEYTIYLLDQTTKPGSIRMAR